LAASPVAAGTSGAQALLGMKTFANPLFLAGTAAFGGGAALAMLRHISGAGEVTRALVVLAVISSLIAWRAAWPASV
jgi:hypothetical protein